MKATTMRQVRQIHNYLAVFFAPAILFFAFTGGLQTLELHEAHADETAPPRWIAAIADLHKHQLIAAPRRRPASDKPQFKAGVSASPKRIDAEISNAGRGEEHDERSFGALKLFVLLLSIALFVTTALGLLIALTTPASRRLSLVLTIAGVVVPLLLVFG